MPRCPRGHDTAAADYCEECGSPLSVLVMPAAASTATAAPNGWLVVTWANRDYHAHMIASAPQFAELVDIPDNYPKRHFVLNGSELLIGRRSRSRGIEPDIDLTGPPEDPGVSHTHALLVASPDGGWSLVDIESANGTYVYIDGEYKRIQANQPVPLEDGDQIYLGAWTALTLTSRFNKRRGIPRLRSRTS